MARRLRRLAAALLVLYACALAGLFTTQRSLLYPASDRRTTAVEAGLIGF